MIRIENMSKSYGNKQVLKSINLNFEQGKIYGIVGENGGGKTTLFRCIAGLEKFKGSISSDPSPLKDHLGLLLTNPYFFDKITGKEYLQLLCNARRKHLNNLDKKNIFDLPLEQYASTYSTGMKKKLALTGILLQENDYFILDEPFNGVDIHSNIVITEIIRILKGLNKTVVISSHIFATLKTVCDDIHVLKDGIISQTVARENFDSLEIEMTEFSLGNIIDRLDLK